MKKRIVVIVMFIVCIFSNVYASGDNLINNENTYYFSEFYNTGHDNGYSEKIKLTEKDLHYGWKLGSFLISGFSGKTVDENGNIVFLKTVGDEIVLYFNLEQDINKLNGNEKLYVSDDKNGYDNEFQINKTNFKKGALIIKKINYQNKEEEPQIYIDYLNGVEKGANTKIDIFEEGDYQVALDYEVVNDGIAFFNNFENYKIRFNFSIRNGNCMVFPMDVQTGQELTNTSVTENGFKIDLARSKYLDINVKKEVYKSSNDGLVEDVRYNRPAKDGEEFKEEGIYTITVKNPYTNEQTIKKIYVGTDKVLKAHVQTGYSIKDIRSLVSAGAIINENGNIENMPEEQNKTEDDNKFIPRSELNNISLTNIIAIIIPILVTIFIVICIIKINKKRRIEQKIVEQKIEQIENDVITVEQDEKEEMKND